LNFSTKGLVWVGRGGILFVFCSIFSPYLPIFWRKTKTQNHMSSHTVQTMISYCSPELGRILFRNLLCCLNSSQTWLIHLVDTLCVHQSTYLPKLKKRNPLKPLAPKPFQAETNLLRPDQRAVAPMSKSMEDGWCVGRKHLFIICLYKKS
jgi:hypothetical protein